MHEPNLHGLAGQFDLLKELIIARELGVEVDALKALALERDRRYEDRFKGQETAVQAALAAQEKFNSAVSAASKEAILKAEASQIGVNERSNEFRGQLADQAATLMPRKETEASMQNIRDIVDREIKIIRAEINSLRESRSELSGRSQQAVVTKLDFQWALPLIVSVVFGIASIVLVFVFKK